MSILGKYTIRSMKCNKLRTLVTVIGIMLSVSMFTAVTESIASGQQYMVNVVKEQTGSFHAYYRNYSREQLKELSENKKIKETAYMETLGYADINSTNPDKPYLFIARMSDNFTSLVSVRLIEGRMPQNENEIILPAHLYANGGVKLSLGEVIRLDIGNRALPDEPETPLTQNDRYDETESLLNTQSVSFTVVGFFQRPDDIIERYYAPGYTALTCGGEQGTGVFNAFFTMNNMSEIYNFLEGTEGWRTNSDLLIFSGVSEDNSIRAFILGFAGILILLIMFGSVSLIYNSFSISLGERTKQFGLLKSIGGTNRQIMRSVFYEAGLLCLAAVPLGLAAGCLGIGVTFIFIRELLSGVLLSSADSAAVLSLHISPWALASASVLSIITVFISAYIPARRVKRVNVIDAVKQSKDIAVKPGRVKTSGLTYKLFGLEGMLASKNFKRNKKQYRAAVFSLFVSVVLFITASSFCSYLNASVNGMLDINGFDIGYTSEDEGDINKTDRLFQALKNAPGVTDGAYAYYYSGIVEANGDTLDDTFLEYEQGTSDGINRLDFIICFAEDQAFDKLAGSLGVQGEGAIACNLIRGRRASENGNVYYSCNIFDAGLSGINAVLAQPKEIEGYSFSYSDKDENGDVFYVYNKKADENGSAEQETLRLNAEEAEQKTDIRISAVIDDAPYFAQGGTLIFRASMKETIMGGMNFGDVSYRFISSDHQQSYDKMSEMLQGMGMPVSPLYDYAASVEASRALASVVNIFSYGFIILISMIAIANVFNTISTGITLRRREFAMLKSVGMTRRGFNKMMNYECVMYGIKGLLYGLPTAAGLTYLIYLATMSAYDTSFYLPWHSVVISIGSVFIVVFATMLYSMRKIKRENPIDALKNDNI